MSHRPQPEPGLVLAVTTSSGCVAVMVWLMAHDRFATPSGGLAAPGWAAVWGIGCVLLAVATGIVSQQSRCRALAGPVILMGWMGPLIAAIPLMADPVRAAGYAARTLVPIALITLVAPIHRDGAPRWLCFGWVMSGCGALVMLGGYNPMVDLACTRNCLPIAGPLSGWSQDLVRDLVLVLVAGSLAAGLLGLRLIDQNALAVAVVAAAAGTLILTWRVPMPPPWHSDDAVALVVASVGGLVTSEGARVVRRRQSARRAAASLLADPRASLEAFEAVPREGLSGAERLALANAQLALQLRRDVAELQDSRRRIVERADAERQRLGQELHDGVQQRVVGAMLHVRAEAMTANEPDRGRLEEAASLIRSSLPPLRSVSGRGAPPLVDSDGLVTALRQRVADAPDTKLCMVGGHRRPDLGSSRQAYVVIDALLDAPAQGPRTLTVTIDDRSIRVQLAGGPRALPESVRDRVLAAGGCVVDDGSTSSGAVEVSL